MADIEGVNLRDGTSSSFADGSESAATSATDDERPPLGGVPLDFDQYELQERRRKRLHARMIWSAVALATLTMPLAYLQLTGQFSLANLHRGNQVVHRKPAPPLKVYDVIAQRKLSPSEQAQFDRLKSDLTQFVNHDLPRLQSDEKVAVLGFANITGRNFKDTHTTLLALQNEVIPAQERLVSNASNLHARTPEVTALVEKLSYSAKMRLVAYRQMLTIDTDPDGLWQYGYKADAEEADDYARQYQKQLTELSIATGVKAL